MAQTNRFRSTVIEIVRRQQIRENLSVFRDLFKEPHDLSAGPLFMPSPGRLAISHSNGLTAGEVVILVGARRTFTHPSLNPDQIARGIYAEATVEVTAAGVPTGTLTLYIVDPLDGTHGAVATQVVA